MALIFESKSFTVNSVEKPHIDRGDGGHIIISPKERLLNIQQLTPKEAIELSRLTIVTGMAMSTVMNKNGVDIGRINYQDNGNWSVFKKEGPYLHVHLYGRAVSAKVHKYGQACYFPHMEENPEYYQDFKPLTENDVVGIRSEIERLLKTSKYSDFEWRL